jgi:hypothetical protein
MEAAIAWFNERHTSTSGEDDDDDDDEVRASSCWGNMLCRLIPCRKYDKKEQLDEYRVSDETIEELLATILNFNSFKEATKFKHRPKFSGQFSQKQIHVRILKLTCTARCAVISIALLSIIY